MNTDHFAGKRYNSLAAVYGAGKREPARVGGDEKMGTEINMMLGAAGEAQADTLLPVVRGKRAIMAGAAGGKINKNATVSAEGARYVAGVAGHQARVGGHLRPVAGWSQACSIILAAVMVCTSPTASGQTILPTNSVPSEVITSLAPSGTPPDPTSAQYASVFEQTNSPVLFNNVTQPTRSVILDGITIVIDDSLAGGYWGRYNGATDIAQFTINASNVIFRSHLALPGTTVTINCADLRFESNPADGGIDNAAVDVTPVAPGPATAVSQNGTNGQPSGNFNLSIATFHSDPTGTNRFIARGGRGGDPGPGANGLNGQSMPDATQFWNNVEPNGAAGMPNGSLVYIDYQYACKKCNPSHQAYYGTGLWPTSGQNATPAGKPGSPGAAGTVTTTVDVSHHSDLTGGTSGTQGQTYEGGAQGLPSTAFWATETYNTDGGPYWAVWAGPSYTVNGTNAASPPADLPVGANGAQVIVGATNTTWVTSGYARAELSFAQDAYRSEFFALAQSALADLAADLATATNSAEVSTLVAVQGQAQTLLHRLAAGNTYWNWPINYAPLLSLQVTTAAFTSAIQNSLYPVYLDQVLHSANRSITDKLAAVQQSKQNLIADLATQATTISNTLTTIPILEQEAVTNQQTILQLQTDQQLIAQLEVQEAETLVQDAQIQQQTPFWQTLLRVGSAIADFTPYGAATTALVNGTINVANDLNDINSSSPWQTIAAVPDLTSALGTAFGTGSNSFFTTTSTLETRISGLAPTNNQNWAAYLSNLQAVTAPLKTGVTNLSALLTSTPITSSQVQAVLNNIKATDPTLSNIANALNAALQQKQALAQAAATAVQTISTAQDQIQADLLALTACSQQLDTGSLVLSYDLMKNLDAISARALDQIAWYQALMAAAYRYQWLRQYPGNFELNDLIQQVQQLAETAPVSLNPSDFAPVVSLYETDLTTIDNAIVDYYNNNFFPLQTGQIYDLDTNAIAQLNSSNGVLHLNLAEAGLFPPDQQNVRIVGIGFYNITTEIPDGYTVHQIATLTVNVRHSGLSTISYNGDLYGFYHYASDAQNPVIWSAKIDLKHGTTNIATPSPVLGSLVGELVGLPNASIQEIFASLGADSDLDISIEAYSDNNIPIKVTGLSLDVQYVYQNLPPGFTTVEVRAQPGTTPEIAVDTPDFQLRTNGFPGFLRYYNNNATSTIHLTAPKAFQNMTFQSWVDQFGNLLSSNSVITLNLGQSQVITPVYQPSTPLFAAAFQGSTVQGQTVVVWPTPTPMSYGTPLGTNQLNAIASAAGTYAYSPPAETILPPGSNALMVVFTPTSSATYSPVTNSVTLLVTYAPPTLGSFPLAVNLLEGLSTNISAPLTPGAAPASELRYAATYDSTVVSHISFAFDGTNLTAAVMAGSSSNSTTVAVSVSDGVITITNHFTVNVRPVGVPVLAPIPTQSTVVGVPITIPLNLTSPNVDISQVEFSFTDTNFALVKGLAFSLTNAVERAMISLVTNQVGTDYITIIAYDGFRGTAQSFLLNVTGPIIHASVVNGSLSLGFNAAPSSVYIIQTATSLRGPWTPVATVTANGGGVINYVVQLNANSTAQFFRAVQN